MEQRETFIEYGDLLRELAAQCRAAEAFLSQGASRELDSMDQLAEWVARREGRVADGLERCAEEGPANMVSRRLQFMPEHRAWEAPEDRVTALQQAVAVNNAVASVLREETEKSVPVDVGEQMDDLTRQVDAINRKVSLALVTSQDL
jgi:hypothetical protein